MSKGADREAAERTERVDAESAERMEHEGHAEHGGRAVHAHEGHASRARHTREASAPRAPRTPGRIAARLRRSAGNIGRIARLDARRLRRSVIGLAMAMGLVIIPCLYAWFNIAGSWDPYGNTGGLRVAVVNEDAGYASELMPVRVNLGESVVGALRANSQMGWEFVDEEAALEGVRSGIYYAAVVIPADFSEGMLAFLSGAPEQTALRYYENQKASAIAPRVTDKGADAIRAEIDATFDRVLSDVGLAALSDAADFADSDALKSYAARLSAALDAGIAGLERAGDDATSLAGLLDAASGLIAGGGEALGSGDGTAGTVRELLGEVDGGLDGVGSGVGAAVEAVGAALDAGATDLDAVAAQVDEVFAAGTGQAGDTASGLEALAAQVDERVAADERVLDELERLFPHLDGAHAALAGVIARERALAEGLRTAAGNLTDGAADAEEAHEAVRQAIDEGRGAISGARKDVADGLDAMAEGLSGHIGDVAEGAADIAGQLDAVAIGLSGTAGSLADDLQGASGALGDATALVNDGVEQMRALKDGLDAALASGDAAAIRALIGSDPTALASALAAPVSLAVHPVYHIENYGSAMAPFYTAVSLWVGGIVLAAMLTTEVPERLVRRLGGARPFELYLGRACLFAALALLQSTVMLLGELFFLGIQCNDPLGYLLAGWFGGLVSCLFVYALTSAFGEVGKAVAVVLLVMQVGGSGGTFPIEMTAPFFQAVYPLLPAAHLINALHTAMAGGWGMEYWRELGCLALYLVPVLALGFVRRPAEWLEEHLGETGLM